jgi:hypothetical protein
MVARAVAAAACAACLSGVLTAAAAEPTASELSGARELFARAEKDEDAERWDAALEKLRRAATVKTTPGLRFHIGLCEEKLGQLVAALNDYAASEALARTEGNKEVLQAVTEPLATLQARVPTLTVKVQPDTLGLAVTLDGVAVPAGLLGAAMRVEVGRHVVAATAAARQPFSAPVTLEERDAKTVDVVLPSTSPPPMAPSMADAPVRAASRSSNPGSHAPALVATGATVVLVGVGVVSFLVAGSKQSDAQAECRQLVSCDDLKAPIRAFDWLALGAWVGGAAAGTLAVILWATPNTARSTAELLIGPGSVGWRTRF